MGNSFSQENKPVTNNKPNLYYVDREKFDRDYKLFGDHANNVWGQTRDRIILNPEKDYSTFPYITEERNDKKYQYDPIVSTEAGPKFVEVIVCRGNLGEEISKHPISGQIPPHDCGPNCNCTKEIIEINGTSNYFNSARKNGLVEKLRSGDMDYIVSPTSSEPHEFYRDRTFRGGANDNQMNMDTSPEDITDSDEQNDTTTTTSEMSSTSSVPSIGESKVSKNNKSAGISKISDNKLIFDSDNKDQDDEDDEDDEELEGLDTEGGFVLSNSDITTSDLYNLQMRIFRSETETDDDTDSETTENVRRALNNINSRKNIFDTEDRKILNMNSTEKWTGKTTKKNNKYH